MNKDFISTNLFLFTLTFLFFVSCSNEFESYKDDEIKAIEEYISGKDYTDIGGYDIYLKFHNRTGIEQLDGHVEFGDAFLIEYDMESLDGELLTTTDSAKGAVEFPDTYKVYGPKYLQTYSGISPFALDTAIRFFSVGDTGSVVFPSWHGWNDQAPKVIHLSLLKIIENDSAYAADKFANFVTTNNFTEELYDGAYFKFPTTPDSTLNDSAVRENGSYVSVNITARYAETYYSNGHGRAFYPLLTQPTTFDSVEIGETTEDFPFVDVLDSALLKMDVGETIEIVLPQSDGWAEYGYTYSDNNTSITIVPPYTPLHYTIELLNEFE